MFFHGQDGQVWLMGGSFIFVVRSLGRSRWVDGTGVGKTVGTRGPRCCWWKWKPVPGCTDSLPKQVLQMDMLPIRYPLIHRYSWFLCIKATTFNAVIAASVLSLFWWCLFDLIRLSNLQLLPAVKSPQERSSQWLPALRLLTTMPIRWLGFVSCLAFSLAAWPWRLDGRDMVELVC